MPLLFCCVTAELGLAKVKLFRLYVNRKVDDWIFFSMMRDAPFCSEERGRDFNKQSISLPKPWASSARKTVSRLLIVL